MREYLEKRQKALEEKRAKLIERSQKSESIDEVRAINDELMDIAQEMRDITDQLGKLDTRAVNADVHSQIVGSFKAPEARQENPLASVEYRTAFMKYVTTGEAIPAEFRAGGAIDTGDTGAAIPITVVNEIINTVRKRYGSLYSRVRKISVKGGVEFAVGALQATFKWVQEKTVSPRQDIGKLGKVSFGYHVAEIRIAQSFLSSVVTLDAFETEIVRVIAVAYMQAMDYAIVNGTGDGQPLGIKNDARVTNVVTLTAADMGDWTAWKKKFFAKLQLGYEAGDFIFAKSTVVTYLETMADANNRPIFREATGLVVGSGDADMPAGEFFGRYVSLVEPDILPDFDTANANDVIGIFYQPEEYAINENQGFTMRRYFDEETNEWVDKALVIVDGKVLNPAGMWLIKKGS